MRKRIILGICLLVVAAVPSMLFGQGRPSRGNTHFPGSATFDKTMGAFTSKHDSFVIEASGELQNGVVLEYIVFTQSKSSEEWVIAETGTIQEAGFDLPFCFPDTKKIMVILSSGQKNAGKVVFQPGKCKKQ